MIRVLFTLLLLIFLHPSAHSQNQTVDQRARSIPQAHTRSVENLAAYIKQEFPDDSSRIRAIYVWIAEHIGYDVPRLQAMKRPGYQPQTVEQVLSSRKSVCQGYSELFVAVCKAVGIPALVVSGYTKQQGRLGTIGHAWVAAKLEGKWWLFDPTWGAGYVKDERFVKWFNNIYYKLPPEKMIGDHMPFDPLYQFLSRPLTNREFTGGTPAATTALFHFEDSLNLHLQLPLNEQLEAELRRMQANGIQNDLLREHQNYLREAVRSFTSKNAFDEGNKTLKTVFDTFKNYIDHKNKQFSALNDEQLRQMMDSMVYLLNQARSLVSAAEASNDAQRQAKNGTISNIDKFWTQLSREKEFVDKYLGTDKSKRLELFMRRSS